MATTKEDVTLGWVVRARSFKEKIVKEIDGRCKKERHEVVKTISERYLSPEAAQVFCDLAVKALVPHQYESVWVAEEVGPETAPKAMSRKRS